jgi:hypothetical protein
VHADFLDVARHLERGKASAAARRYRGPLLPASDVAEIAAERVRLERGVAAEAAAA